MTVAHRTRTGSAMATDEIASAGVDITCDSCHEDLTHSVRIKCADSACEGGDGVDICPACFCKGKEFGDHKRWHKYRVIELPSYPIFEEDWGADEELLLIEGALLQGLGNWAAIAEHIGTRTKAEVEEHYHRVYINSDSWPIPDISKDFDIDPEEFHRKKRRRIEALPAINAAAVPKPAPTSAPGFHEIATFLPGRLEFEHEIDNDAEDLVKDLEFGLVYQFSGDEMPEDDEDLDIKAKRARLVRGPTPMNADTPLPPGSRTGSEYRDTNPLQDGTLENGTETSKDKDKDKDKDKEEEDAPHIPLPIESEDSTAFKLTLVEMYLQRVEKRHDAKQIIFERGLLEYKKMQAQEKKRSREEKDILHRFRPFAKLQTAEDYEVWVEGMLYEANLRRRIAALQNYRRNGITSHAGAEKYDADLTKRIQIKSNIGREYSYTERRGILSTHRAISHTESEGGKSRERDITPQANGSGESVNGIHLIKPRVPAPLNLANSPSLSLLSPAEQTLCSHLRILPKPYLAIKETIIGAFIRSGGTLRKREARELVKIDVNKSTKIWDFFQQSGWFKMPDQGTVSESVDEDKMVVDPPPPIISPMAPLIKRESSTQSFPAPNSIQSAISHSSMKFASVVDQIDSQHGDFNGIPLASAGSGSV